MDTGDVQRAHLPYAVEFRIAAADDDEEMRTASPSHRFVSFTHGVHCDGAVPLVRQWSPCVMQDDATRPRCGCNGVVAVEMLGEL